MNLLNQLNFCLAPERDLIQMERQLEKEYHAQDMKQSILKEEIRGKSVSDLWKTCEDSICESEEDVLFLFNEFWEDNPKSHKDIFSDLLELKLGDDKDQCKNLVRDLFSMGKSKEVLDLVFERMFVTERFKLALEDIEFELRR